MIYDLSEGISALALSFHSDNKYKEQQHKFITAVGYDTRSDGQLDEKIYMFRYFTLDLTVGLPVFIYAGKNPTPIDVTEKALEHNGLVNFSAQYTDNTF